ncbi:MAG: TIGR03862 family flavoprotein [Roseibium sp.]|uniref:TIGR03862 family flavoprotein n=1 Tax=Roseibium sp. TaxID=1936156 RepID=UPI002626C985|nr:TIGR03862 family flavoprotein [Roseibium sp.]MCV0429016.1 TIGR03862 family flavoprotein [Roseibium sp.]
MLDVLILGAGPAGLFAADQLSSQGHSVLIVDRMPSPARKFLMAGRGGLNLTHSEDLATFVSRYRNAEEFLTLMIRDYPPEALREWCHDLGQETFVGSSGRVFPKTMKASPLLRAWLRRLEGNGVQLRARHRFSGFSDDGFAIVEPDGEARQVLPARTTLLALGGASWPKLGSDADWVSYLENRDIKVNRFQPSNCGFKVNWSSILKARAAGAPLKRIAVKFGEKSVPGEAVISEEGLEGGAIYALSADIRDAINANGSAEIRIDLRPSSSIDDLVRKLARPRGKQSYATFLKKVLKLNPAEQILLREPGPFPDEISELAGLIKSIPIRCVAPYSIDRAISSAGGISLDELDYHLMLKKLPGIYAAGEMLDWEAPTGGYLLQACFAMSYRAANGIAAILENKERGPAT